jgi:hypothetical protein
MSPSSSSSSSETKTSSSSTQISTPVYALWCHFDSITGDVSVCYNNESDELISESVPFSAILDYLDDFQLASFTLVIFDGLHGFTESSGQSYLLLFVISFVCVRLLVLDFGFLFCFQLPSA